MSNVAAANIIFPALACVGPAEQIAPLYVLTPVAIAASLAFLFPIGTPPNAIVLGNKNITTRQMLIVGTICTVLCMSTVLLYSIYICPLIYDVYNVPSSVLDECD